MFNSVTRCKIFSEFSEEQQNYWFSLKEKAVRHHIDTLYYSVYIEGDSSTSKDEGLQKLLSDLSELKEQKKKVREDDFEFFGLDVALRNVISGVYVYCLELPQYYDIYVAQSLPNDNTPRIHVQLRTQSLVVEGLLESVEQSFDKVCSILDAYGLSVREVVENRIDYAFHTNVIQKPSEMFADEKLNKHLDTSFVDGLKHFYLKRSRDEMIDLDYLALGNRRSNHLFFRIYDKGKEVVEQNYKAFFFKVWEASGLISKYDRFCYEYAYLMRSYKTGLLLGRIEWYMQNGWDDELKAKLERLVETCNINSDNNPRIESEIKGILPPVTKILNFEYETRRSWYLRHEDFLQHVFYIHEGPEALRHLFHVLYCRPHFIKRLTTDVVCFVENRQDVDSKPLDFWRRIQRCKIGRWYYFLIDKSYSTYSREFDKLRMKTRLLNTVASLSVMVTNSTSERELGSDMWDIIGMINDNDVYGGDVRDIFNIRYRKLRRRKARQMRALIKEEKPVEDDE